MHSTRTRLRPRFNGWIVSSASSTGAEDEASLTFWLRATLLGCLGVATTLGALLAGTGGLQNAIANGDTRTLSFYHAHSRESLTVTFRRNGRYDRAALQQLNWFLRDWRNDETTSMDPKLFDIVWAAQREAGSRGTIRVLSAYRSPNTNAMLRRRSSAVAKNSQHMQGRALDFSLPDADMARVRAIGMRLQRGGVGYYPNVPFVHLDSGSVRSWPRMPRNQLARLFPDGKTVHLPADGKPLEGYELAKREILARGDSVAGATSAQVAEAASQPQRRRSFWATLFGGADEAEDADIVDTSTRRQVAARRNTDQVAQNTAEDDNDPRRFFLVDDSRRQAPDTRQPARAAAPALAPQAPAAVQDTRPAGRPVAILPPVPASPPAPEAPAPQTPVAPFEGPLPVARPASPVLPDVPSPVVAPPQPANGIPALIAALPPARPGAPASEPETPAVAVAALSAVPVPPVRPPAPVAVPVPGADRNALAAIAAVSGPLNEGRANDSQADATIQTAALAYAPAPPLHAAAPLPPVRPQPQQPNLSVAAAPASAEPPKRAAPAVRLSPSLPPAAGNDERRALTQLFASVATDARPLPRATVRTAKVVTAATPARAPAPVTAPPPGPVVQMAFTRSASASDLSTDSFQGPAVQPLPVTRFGQ